MTYTMAEPVDDGTLYARSPTFLTTIHYASPIILFFFFLTFFLANSVVSAKRTSAAKKDAASDDKNEKSSENDNSPVLIAATPARRLLFIWVTAAIIATFFANAAEAIIHVILEKEDNWWCGRDVAVYIVAGLFDFALILLTLVDSKPTPNVSHLSTWVLAAVLEAITFDLELDVYSHTHREPTSSLTEPGQLRYGITDWEVVELTLNVVRMALLIMLIVMYLAFRHVEIQKRYKESQEDDKTLVEEASPLLPESAAENYGSAGGTLGVPTNGSDAPIAGVNNGGAAADQLPIQAGADDETTPLLNGSANKKSKKAGKKPDTAEADKEPGWARKDKVPNKSWFEYLQGYTVFFPYLWPSKDMRLQALFVLCVIIVLIGRVVQVMVPIQVGAITNTLSGEDGEISVPWFGICFYIFLRFMQGGNGVLGAIRSQLWVPISQYSYRELTVAAFEHVHHLSLDFHLSKKTGEVISAIGKGSSINGFLEQITFQVVPMLIDLIIAIGYFLIYFDAYYALTVAVVVFIYLYVTMKMASWRVDVRRDWVNFSRQEDAIKNDSLMSYESVKYFNAEQFEFSRFRDAVNKSQGAEYKVLVSLNYLNVSQNTIFLMGLLITSFIAAYQVSTGEFKVGRFVALLTYMAQLQQPLNFFGMFYRSIQSSMINSERLLEIFKEKNSVADRDGAQKLTNCEGDIKFQDVVFGYGPNKTALKGVTFHCKPGTTTALVGESGGGKSTIFRLLYRFYDVNDGTMTFDGHDSKDLTIDSLRSHIGVVPQDTVLFNESIMFNLRYANQSATDEEIFAACRAASIHDKILTYDKGYETIVGERGLKLSGGEKQRVAIARCLIKNPQIILLDEATASLDTETEENIQEALDSVLATGRTILVIAHRLSTITTADQILVMSNGRIVESGTHEELVEKKGKYSNMWSKQIRAQLVLEKARKMRAQAEQLAKEGQGESRAGSSGASDDEDSGAGPSWSRTAGPSMSNSGFLTVKGGHAGHHGHGASDSRDGADHFHG